MNPVIWIQWVNFLLQRRSRCLSLIGQWNCHFSVLHHFLFVRPNEKSIKNSIGTWLSIKLCSCCQFLTAVCCWVSWITLYVLFYHRVPAWTPTAQVPPLFPSVYTSFGQLLLQRILVEFSYCVSSVLPKWSYFKYTQLAFVTTALSFCLLCVWNVYFGEGKCGTTGAKQNRMKRLLSLMRETVRDQRDFRQHRQSLTATRSHILIWSETKSITDGGKERICNMTKTFRGFWIKGQQSSDNRWQKVTRRQRRWKAVFRLTLTSKLTSRLWCLLFH